MSLDGFLTFIGLMIATYAILSPVSRLKLRLKMYRQLVLSAVAITLVGFFEFYFELKSIAPDSISGIFFYVVFNEQASRLSNQEAAFLVVIIWLLLAVFLHARAKPRAISLGTLKTLSERLHDEGRYLELVELVYPYLGTIREAVEKRLFNQRFHHRILDIHSRATNPLFAILNDDKPLVLKWLACRIKPLASLVPARSKAHDAAIAIDDLILQSDEIRNLLVRLKPEFAMILMDRSGEKNEEFRTQFFRDAINDRASHFYKELKATQSLSRSTNGYEIEPNSVLLTGFFGNALVGERLGIWKPIGDEALRLIESDQAYAKILNGPCPSDEELWKDPTYNIIHFFDIMVRSAAGQDVPNHMWLMYMSVFVCELEKIHHVTDDRVNLEDEFPTLGNRLIYEATYCLQKWVQLVNDLPATSSHMDAKSLRGPDGASIPYWAVKGYLGAMRHVLKSERLTDRFITCRLESYIREVGKLQQTEPISHLRNMMVDKLINGESSNGGEDLRAEIRTFIHGVDRTVFYNAPDFNEALWFMTTKQP